MADTLSEKVWSHRNGVRRPLAKGSGRCEWCPERGVHCDFGCVWKANVKGALTLCEDGAEGGLTTVAVGGLEVAGDG